MRYGKTEALLQLALELSASHGGLSLNDIETMFDVGRRTAQRMRDAIARVFPQLEEVPQPDRTKRWRLPTKALGRVSEFHIDDIMALEIAADILDRDNRPDAAISVRRVEAKARASLQPADARRMEPDLEALMQAEGVAMRPGPRYKVNPQLVENLRHAILACHEVRVRYRRRYETIERDRTIHPYGILYGQRHYLLAFVPEENEVRSYSFPNIIGIEETGKSFIRDPNFSLPEYVARSFGVYQQEPFNVVWRFSPDAAADARDFLFHPSQTLEDQPDGGLIIRFQAGGLLEMAWHVYQWGDAVEVLEPEELRMIHERSKVSWPARP
ncbi:WYL domain-containing protein [Magnetospirillum sp. ME-1]|uniref:helix-turn-helix transcriptional regulator n=1 Tax=Magnetospirillum sp. ME-1 TaxID=1639348 RepID=UPI000A17AFE1|nr:WYL domain-containing protein [Magnetospirillum sp. ME-1]ARJ66191.1 WYL domain-containing protein [Magnetospirillum sp. ME-1]